MSDLTFYHVSPALLEVGSVILPGNWGRITKKTGWSAPNKTKELQEAHLEYIRQRFFKEFPSRLSVAFVFPTKIDMDHFIEPNTSFDLGIRYRVRLKNPSAKSVVSLYDLVAPNPGKPFSPNWAREYWDSTIPLDVQSCTESVLQSINNEYNTYRREILTLSPLVIEEQISD